MENSTRLFFRRDGELVPANYVDIINSRTIRLRYPIRQPQDEGLFTCILNRTHGEQQFIGSQRVLADCKCRAVDETTRLAILCSAVDVGIKKLIYGL